MVVIPAFIASFYGINLLSSDNGVTFTFSPPSFSDVPYPFLFISSFFPLTSLASLQPALAVSSDIFFVASRAGSSGCLLAN